MKIELTFSETGRTVLFDQLPVILGRDGAVDLRLDDDTVDRCQCMISTTNGHSLVVWDFGTGEGTLVNGRQISKSALAPGDTLRIGKTELVVEYQLVAP